MTQLPPMPLVDGALLIDNSTIEKLRCPRLLQYEWLHKRSLATSKAGRNFGSCLHVGWAIRYSYCGNAAITAPIEALQVTVMQDYLHEHPQPLDDFRSLDHACKVMMAYNEHYLREPFTVLKNPKTDKFLVECSFAIPFDVIHDIPVIYIGKIDMAVSDNTGIWSHDHKTAFQFGNSWDAQMAVDGGQTGYTWALKQVLPPELSAKVTGYVIDGVRIRRPKREDEYTGKAPIDASDFKRMPFFVGEDALEDWRNDTTHLIGNIITYHKQGYFPRHRWQCTNKFGTCDMYDVCSLPAYSREKALESTLYEDNNWSPLNLIINKEQV